MKLIFRILFFSAIALIAAACASSSATPTAAPDSGAASVKEDSDQAYVPSDVSLVANTGKPQFLDSYADW